VGDFSGSFPKPKMHFVALYLYLFIRGEGVHIYHRAGDDAVLSCKRPSSSLSCSTVDWFYTRAENMERQHEVHGGKVQSSARAARLRLDNKCSLIINTITAEDAGRYTCQLWDGGRFDTDVYLNMMSTSEHQQQNIHLPVC
uniref:Ig-like domain-containing protein n=1 Tax=Fundulus heteroclitus TaxID=8078 RepID=A0A3Q2QJ38_FUNHE